MAVAFQTNDPELAAVSSGVVVDRHVAHRLAVADARVESPPEHHVEVETDCVDPLSEQRCRDELAQPSSFAREQRSGDRACELHACGVISHAATLERQCSADRLEQVGDA